LGAKAASMIVAQASYEVTDPTIDSQIVSLKGSGADTFFNITTLNRTNIREGRLYILPCEIEWNIGNLYCFATLTIRAQCNFGATWFSIVNH